jgi:predicted Rossmann fold flavoprotein
MPTKRLVVIGGGAAGFFCAVNAASLNPSLEVVIIEKTGKLLSKVKVSGGGRCNVTHACFDIADMSKRYPRGGNFVKKTFHQFFTTDTIRWFEEKGVTLKAEPDGRMFPVTDNSQTIIDCLLKEVNRQGVQIRLNTEVKQLNRKGEQWALELENAPAIVADFVCIACGGYPKTSMFEWLRQLGHTIEEPVPSLFTFNIPKHPITQLMGVSVATARIKIFSTKLEEEGPLLVTHWGLSGPAVLKLSAWGARELKTMNYEFSILVNWMPEYNEQQLAEKFRSFRFDLAAQKIANKNPLALPQRLWEFLLEQAEVSKDKRWADLPAKEQNKLIRQLCASPFDVRGKTTFKEEFVTAGGIRLNEVDANTMMSKKNNNLFFAGEILDVDGITGGFNFQHAWTSGWIAARAISVNQ